MMRALVVHEFGPVDSHRVEEIPTPKIGDHDVLLDVHAIGLNFPDTLMLQGKYQTRPDRPFVPGRDAAGVVSGITSWNERSIWSCLIFALEHQRIREIKTNRMHVEQHIVITDFRRRNLLNTMTVHRTKFMHDKSTHH